MSVAAGGVCGESLTIPEGELLLARFGCLKHDGSNKFMFRAYHHSLGALWFLIPTLVFVSGCGVTLSPVKRQPLQIFPAQTSLAPNPQAIIVRFESTLPGVPLSETVWDNRSGAFADTKESTQIGYTQDYTKLLLPPAMAAPLQPSYTRIFIPFGRLFEDVFQSKLEEAFPNSPACAEETKDLENFPATWRAINVRLKVVEFWVWENPLNHLNMKTTVECRVFRGGVTNQPEYVYEAHCEATKQSIGSALSTSRHFLKEMDKISNQFASRVSDDILENLQKHLGKQRKFDCRAPNQDKNIMFVNGSIGSLRTVQAMPAHFSLDRR